MAATARERFTALVSGGTNDIDLAKAALLIAAEGYDEIDVDRFVSHYIEELNALAVRAQQHIAAEDGREVDGLIGFLAKHCGFRGNDNDYYDRRNSYFNEVLDRRIGIPITLALVYVEVGHRCGLDVRGVGFPGHFLAVHVDSHQTVIDPFFGTVLDEAGCTARLRAVAGPEAELDPSHLAATAPRDILTRMLGNLKLIHLRAREFEDALRCSERILLVRPDSTNELRDRAALYLQLECFDAARADLERFLEVAPNDESAGLVRNELVKLQTDSPVLH